GGTGSGRSRRHRGGGPATTTREGTSMAKDMSGTGRLTIFPLLHDWGTGSRCTLAYTTPDAGLTAVLGVIPVEGNEFELVDLFAMSVRLGFIGWWTGSIEQ